MRSAQRRFVRATGITYAAYRTIERARIRRTCCARGFPIIDVAHRAGYYDQPHLTRSLKYLIGQTPLEVARATRQLSFLYKTTSGGAFYGESEGGRLDAIHDPDRPRRHEPRRRPRCCSRRSLDLATKRSRRVCWSKRPASCRRQAGALVRLDGGQISTSEGPFGQGDRRRVRDLQRRVEAGSDRLGEEIHGAAPGALERWQGETEVRRMIEQQPSAGAPRG